MGFREMERSQFGLRWRRNQIETPAGKTLIGTALLCVLQAFNTHLYRMVLKRRRMRREKQKSSSAKVTSQVAPRWFLRQLQLGFLTSIEIYSKDAEGLDMIALAGMQTLPWAVFSGCCSHRQSSSIIKPSCSSSSSS